MGSFRRSAIAAVCQTDLIMTGSDACVRTSWPLADVMLIELNRPQRHNALDAEMVSRLTAAFDEPGARAVILTSSHPDTFCSGADLSISNDERVVVSERLYGLYETIVRLPIPVIAAIGGHAIGGGAQLAIACDLRIASPQASFRFLGVGHGLVVGAWALPRFVGAGRAFELCATMRPSPRTRRRVLGWSTSSPTIRLRQRCSSPHSWSSTTPEPLGTNQGGHRHRRSSRRALQTNGPATRRPGTVDAAVTAASPRLNRF